MLWTIVIILTALWAGGDRAEPRQPELGPSGLDASPSDPRDVADDGVGTAYEDLWEDAWP